MVDATKVSKIKIETGYAGVKEYPVFSRPDGKAGQCAIILGGNGTGKSTIARALSAETKGVEFFDDGNNSLGKDCSNVHVFSESYVIKNFRTYEQEHLDAVILLGESGRILDRINGLKEKITELENKSHDVYQTVLNRLFESGSFSSKDWVGHFSIKDYVGACIKNELNGISDDPFIDDGDDDLFDSLIDEGKLNLEIYLRWALWGYKGAQWEINPHYPEEDYDKEFQYEEYEDESWDDRSSEWFNQEVKSADESLRSLISAVYSSDGYKSHLLFLGSHVNNMRDSYNLILMRFFYKFYPKLYGEFAEGFSDENEQSMYQTLKANISELQGHLEFEMNKLERERKDESAKGMVEYINQLLHIVLGGNKLYLESAKHLGYKVKSSTGREGEVIPPSKLSVGEQNILSLCYFMASIAEGKNISGFLREEQLIVLDDPVSSFDDGNKYGVTSLLGYLCQSILSKTSKTKLIIMTHDLSFALNMSKMIKAIDDSKLSCWELQKDSSDVLIKSKFEDIDRYADMLRIMYDFAEWSRKKAVVPAPVPAPVPVPVPAPNDVRRVWEAFVMFELGMTSIAEMGEMKNLSASFADDQRIERFVRIFIPQLFINTDSHAKSQAINGNLYLNPTLVGEPYEDFVKSIVCFMHIIAPRHIAWRMKKYKGEGKKILDFVDELDKLLKHVLPNN